MEIILNSASGTILEEDTLRAVAKDLRASWSLFLYRNHDGDIIKQLERYFDVLFETALATSIPSAHRTACCNLLCGSIEQCLAAKDHQIVNFACSTSICQSLHALYYDCFDHGKEKSMKQVLSTIVLVLSKNSSPESPTFEVVQCLEAIFTILFQRHERNQAKPALHALNVFLSKDLITTGVAITRFQHWETQADLVSKQDKNLNEVQRFLTGIFQWVTVPDTAPSVGLVISCFLKKLTIRSDNLSNSSIVHTGEVPVWAEPLLLTVSKNTDEIQTFRSYILPSLLQRNCEEFWRFLSYLNIENHLRLEPLGSVASVEDGDLHRVNSEHLLLFSSLQVGKELGLIVEMDHRFMPGVRIHQKVIEVSDLVLGRLLDFSTPDVRLCGMALLLTSKRSTKPYTNNTLKLIAKHLPNFYADPDPEVRAEVQGLVKTLINRLRVILASLKRACIKEDGFLSEPSNVEPTTKHRSGRMSANLKTYWTHKRFLIWYTRFLTVELHPSASYQRHISSLKSLNAILRSGLDQNVQSRDLSRQAKLDVDWPCHVNVLDGPMRRCLLDILLDPFEDVRQMALEALSLASKPDVQICVPEASDALISALNRARIVTCRSGRADHADGLARFYALRALDTLPAEEQQSSVQNLSNSPLEIPAMMVLEEIVSAIEESIKVASRKLSDAVGKHSVHGYFTSLRYVLELLSDRKVFLASNNHSMSQIFDRAFQSISDIWDCVKPILCNDAPEGFLPDGVEDDLLSTKDVLSFAWRALKDSNLLLQCLVNTATLRTLPESDSERLTRLKVSGSLCFRQLADLRHRGAFSTVAQTFQFICRQCAKDLDPEIQLLSKKWYQDAITLIRQRGAVTTRRSAGIPALIVAILSAEGQTPTFESVMGDLANVASQSTPIVRGQDSELPQVHALNSLKAIFNNPKLAEKSEKYIVEVMNLGSRCLGSHIWSIRNCGLMLFRGLIDRLLGSNESWDEASSARVFSSSRLSYNRYPGLIELLIHHLKDSKSDHMNRIERTI